MLVRIKGVSVFGTGSDEDITPIHTRARAQQLILEVRSNLVNCVLELMLGAMF
jgi:hypothetical protein